MKSVESIKEEYSKYELETKTISYDIKDVNGYIISAISDLDEDRIDIIKAIKINSLRKIRARLMNLISFDKEDLSFYDEDSNFLDKEIDLNLIYKYYYSTMLKMLNEDNILNITKLFDFTLNNYSSNYIYLEEMRNLLDCERNFITYSPNLEEDESVVSFQKFFQEEIKKINSSKSVEKVK